MGSQLLGLTMLFVCLPFGATAIWAVFFSAVCEAFALAVLGPLCESLMSVSIPAKERAHTNSFITAMILLISIPAGGIAGQLSKHNRVLPLVLNLCLLFTEILVALYITRGSVRERK
jgi:MFS family permease